MLNNFSLFNTSIFTEIPINPNTDFRLHRSSFLKFQLNHQLPHYIAKFFPTELVEYYIYFSTEFKNNMLILVGKYKIRNKFSAYRLLAMSSIFSGEEEINFIIEGFCSSDIYFETTSCDKILLRALRPDDRSARIDFKLVYHSKLVVSDLKIKLYDSFLKDGINSIMVPSLFDWLQFDFVEYRNSNFTVCGLLSDRSVNIRCGLDRLGGDLARFLQIKELMEGVHYFFSGDTYGFQKRTVTTNFQGRSASIDALNEPEFLVFRFGFDYYQGDNARDGDVEFKIPISEIASISKIVRDLTC